MLEVAYRRVFAPVDRLTRLSAGSSTRTDLRMGVKRTGRLVDLDDAVARDIREGLTDTTRPSNLDSPSNGVRAQTEVRALVVGGEVTAGC